MTQNMKDFNIPDPFDKIVKYDNINMPFSLALMAKMRKIILKEIKSANIDTIMPKPKEPPQNKKFGRVRAKKVPEKDPKPVGNVLQSRVEDLKNTIPPLEQAKFLENMDHNEKTKRYREMKGRDIFSNYHYNYLSLNKDLKND
eukprot:CAMPEP_0114580738 /NCGR_PEP_ID=MMETSP0125-20121206/4957_1 /TAXON_ID=485358 ORGANISM="Aristerostoma sp., Strain ATCC 50986" /NCGR_SAMPLE_ID=MMETSP0125 /ASSEMBLY_ACC=CAM_ASM_000245 /LENGTH=142 /DNA_ID=CAMNT_0001772467 /DNA_START=1027 /DNA_END=1456 /DNA_ORIENTATION=+